MNHQEYSDKIRALEEPTESNLINLAQWAEESALPWLWQEMAGVIHQPKEPHPKSKKPLGPKLLRPMKDAEAIRFGLAVSVADQVELPTTTKFYHSQLTMLDAEAKRFCKRVSSFLEHDLKVIPEAPVFMVHRRLEMHLRYAKVLLESAGGFVAGVPSYYGAWAKPYDSAFETFKAAEQAVYGPMSGMAHNDLALGALIAILRTAIELRIRDAFCIQSRFSPTDVKALFPVDMSELFQAIKAHTVDADSKLTS